MAKRPKRLGSGKKKGSKNKTTLEREAMARAQIAAEIKANNKRTAKNLTATGIATPEAAKLIVDTIPEKLMKDIAFDFARLFAGMAAIYQPYPEWIRGRNGKLKNANPNFDEAKFKEYAVLAKDTALGAASYQSPKLSAMMIGADVINTITVEGGLPDEQDGGLVDAPTTGEPAYLGQSQDGVAGNDAANGIPGGAGDPADAVSGTRAAVPAEGEIQSGQVRKTVG